MLLVLWMAPGAGALALSLHLAFDHHPSGTAGHDPVHANELVLASLHGLHHAEVAAEHEHSAALEKTVVATVAEVCCSSETSE